MSDGFFDNEELNAALRRAISAISRLDSADPFESSRNQHLSQIFVSMNVHTTEWNDKCSVSVNGLSNQFLSQLQSISVNSTRNDLDIVFALSFRFLFELYLSTNGSLNFELEAARNFGIDQRENFLPDAAHHIDWAVKNLSTFILKSLVSSEHVQNLKNLKSTYLEADRRRTEWDKELKEHEGKVTLLKTSLEKYETAFNFVGLYEGFDSLAKEKDTQKRVVRAWLIFVGIMILVPLFLELLFIRNNYAELETHKTALLFSIVPALSITALLVYYFRVFLHNFNALNSQILQLDLRKTLCRFIHHYADYAKDMKSKNSESLARFEHIIFSPLAPNDEKLPSTFDGVEQLSALVKSLKS